MMLNRIKNHISPALVISIIALVAAIGSGAANALPGAKRIDKNDLKKNVVKSKNVVDNGITGNDVDESTLNLPSSAVPQTTFGATVSSAGTVTVATLPGTTARIDGTDAYSVIFPRSVQGCVPVVSDASAAPHVARAYLPGGSQPNVVFVLLGTGSTAFSVIVTC